MQTAQTHGCVVNYTQETQTALTACLLVCLGLLNSGLSQNMNGSDCRRYTTLQLAAVSLSMPDSFLSAGSLCAVCTARAWHLQTLCSFCEKLFDRSCRLSQLSHVCRPWEI